MVGIDGTSSGTQPPAEPASQSASPVPSQSPSQPTKPGVYDALQTISPIEDLKRLPSVPCARYSLLFGIVAGVSVGALRFLFGTRRGGWATAQPRWEQVGVAANWAVGAWGVTSLGAWETCRARQSAEATRMAALVSEVKARRAARSTSATSLESPQGASHDAIPRVGGVLVGDRGRKALGKDRPPTSSDAVPNATRSDPVRRLV